MIVMRVVFGNPRRTFFDTVTSKILIVNIVVFFLTSFSDSIFGLLALTPSFAVNMFGLLMFGPTIEETMGSKKYLIFYTLCGLGSGIFHILISGISSIPLVGASGAVFGVLTAYGLLFPKNTVYVYYVPMPAIVAIGLFAAIELFSGIAGTDPGVANFGHLGGMIVGFILIKFFGYGKKRDHVYFWDDEW